MILTDEERERIEDGCWSGPGLAASFDRQEFARAIEREVMRKLRDRPADAWLVTGSRIYADSSHITEEHAQRRIVDRAGSNGRPDGSRLVPLHIIPEVNE